MLLESVKVRVCECTPAPLTVVLKLQPISAGTLDIPKFSTLKTWESIKITSSSPNSLPVKVTSPKTAFLPVSGAECSLTPE